MFLARNLTFTYFDICWNKLVKILFFSMLYQYSDTNSYIFSDFFPSISRTYFDIQLFRQISPKFLSSLISTCRNKCESTVLYSGYSVALFLPKSRCQTCYSKSCQFVLQVERRVPAKINNAMIHPIIINSIIRHDSSITH